MYTSTQCIKALTLLQAMQAPSWLNKLSKNHNNENDKTILCQNSVVIHKSCSLMVMDLESPCLSYNRFFLLLRIRNNRGESSEGMRAASNSKEVGFTGMNV